MFLSNSRTCRTLNKLFICILVDCFRTELGSFNDFKRGNNISVEYTNRSKKEIASYKFLLALAFFPVCGLFRNAPEQFATVLSIGVVRLLMETLRFLPCFILQTETFKFNYFSQKFISAFDRRRSSSSNKSYTQFSMRSRPKF